MTVTRNVATKEQLKIALKDKVDSIIITEPTLARNVKLAKGASKVAVLATLAGCGAIAANAWNPVGWVGAGFAAGAVGLSTAGAAVSITGILALAGLGTLFMVMYNDYEFEGEGKAKVGSTNSVGTGEGQPSLSNGQNAGGKFSFKLTKRKKD